MKELGLVRVETTYNLVRENDDAGIAYRYQAICPNTGVAEYTAHTLTELKRQMESGSKHKAVVFGSPVQVSREMATMGET